MSSKEVVDEDVLKGIAAVVLDAVNSELAKVLTPLERRVQELQQRQDKLAAELASVREATAKVAMDTAAEFVKQVVQAAIKGSEESMKGRIEVATEPVISRLNALESRINNIEHLLESAGRDLGEAVAAATAEVQKAGEEAVKRIEESAAAVSGYKQDLEKILRTVESMKLALDGIVKAQARMATKEDLAQITQLRNSIYELMTSMDALRRRLEALEKQVSRRRGGGGEEEEGGEVEM
ncbi:MAG: hypothetical protein ABWK01_07935 [Infirmifilum sp.]